jgi:hypothetical protein
MYVQYKSIQVMEATEDVCEGFNDYTEYAIQDNGGRPYQVRVYSLPSGHSDKVEVYNESSHRDPANSPALTINNPAEVFIGPNADHPMNARQRDGCTAQFRGCTVLVHLSALDYVWIGNRGVLSFAPLSPIIEFESPMGNSNVPYPWALDRAGNYYLMLDDIILQARVGLASDILECGDPCAYYYRHCTITQVQDEQHSRLRGFREITVFWIGNDMYDLRHKHHADKNYDRIIGWDEGQMSLLIDGQKVVLDRDSYIELMEAAGMYMGFTSFDYETICKRWSTDFSVSTL